MLVERLRFLHEDIERLEAALAERYAEEPKNHRQKMARDHEIANITTRIHEQSLAALTIELDNVDVMEREWEEIGTGDTFARFDKEMADILAHHQRDQDATVENLQQAYKKGPNGKSIFSVDMDRLFSTEEKYGRFFDLIILQQEYFNLPGIKERKKPNLAQYVGLLDKFKPPGCQITRTEKTTDEYLGYVKHLDDYLTSFIKRVRPIEKLELKLDKLLKSIDASFELLWEENSVVGWEAVKQDPESSAGQKSADAVWCDDCDRSFANPNVYNGHLTGRKHKRNAQLKKEGKPLPTPTVPAPRGPSRLVEKAIAYHEYRVERLIAEMSTIRDDTRAEIERRAGMTLKERDMENRALDEADEGGVEELVERDQEDGEEKVYNPLHLPLGWDGKPIPFWLYKLHGLGTEFQCEICGNFVYMGRRAFEKHFGEARHIYGLKCLGISNSNVFREITKIEDATKLWEKMQRDKAEELAREENVEEMEDSQGNVMPRRVWEDLKKAGLL